MKQKSVFSEEFKKDDLQLLKSIGKRAVVPSSGI
jgi:hypothetical protein